MKVLKFGGTSVANPENINKVKSILAQQKEQQIAVVVSAFGGVTDVLLNASQAASQQDINYKNSLKAIEDRHISAIRELIPVKSQSAALSKVKSELNVLETLLEGSFLIGEITPKLSDKIVSYGELLSSFIISEFLKSEGLDAVYKDSRELIKTDNHFGKANVDFATTNANCKAYFDSAEHQITLLPGFVASSKSGDLTTLGRGGSDYTAAIIAAAVDADQGQGEVDSSPESATLGRLGSWLGLSPRA